MKIFCVIQTLTMKKSFYYREIDGWVQMNFYTSGVFNGKHAGEWTRQNNPFKFILHLTFAAFVPKGYDPRTQIIPFAVLQNW